MLLPSYCTAAIAAVAVSSSFLVAAEQSSSSVRGGRGTATAQSPEEAAAASAMEQQHRILAGATGRYLEQLIKYAEDAFQLANAEPAILIVGFVLQGNSNNRGPSSETGPEKKKKHAFKLTLAPHEPEKATDGTRKMITSTATVDKKWHQGKISCVCDADYYYAGSDKKGSFFNSEEDCCEWFPDACSNKAIVPGLWYLTEVEGKPTCMFGASDDPGGWAEETDLFAHKRECCNEICDHWILLRMMSWEVDDCSLFGTGMSLGDPLHQVMM
jgi:hypothetical protein